MDFADLERSVASFQARLLEELRLRFDPSLVVADRVNSAAMPRKLTPIVLVTKGSSVLRAAGFDQLLGRLKSSGKLRHLLFRADARDEREIELHLDDSLTKRFLNDASRLVSLTDHDYVNSWYGT